MTIIYTGIGARSAPDHIRVMCKELAIYMASFATLRSGGAEGLDESFELGCIEAKGTKEIYIPEAGFNKRANNTDIICGGLSKYKMAVEGVRQYMPKYDSYDQNAQKFLVRNVFALFGSNIDTPSNLLVTWNIYPNTGSALLMAMAIEADIPVFNMAKDDEIEALQEYVINLQEKHD